MSLSQTMTTGLAVAALAAAGSVDSCQTGPELGPQVEFTVVGPLEAGEVPAVRVDSVSSGQVVLRGGVGTPVPCYDIGAELAERASGLTLTLVATAQPVMCIQVPAVFAYRARIHGLSPGRHTLEVVATYPGAGVAPRTETLQVEIP